MSRPTQSKNPGLATPAFSAVPVSDQADGELQELLFEHPYEAPRGRASAPLAVWPIWFPVVVPPMETLTLDQVLYRSLASVREPFRRTRLLLASGDRVRPLYTALLEWAVRWAESNLGASLVPVALSLSRLAAKRRALELLIQRLPHSGASSALVEILELGMSVPADPVEDLVAAILTGNAWILLEDDCDEGETDLKPVKAAFDAVFGASDLSHTAIVLVTGRERCTILSDIQTFSEKAPEEVVEITREVPTLLRPAALLCRVLSRCGSPPMKPSVIATVILALGFLAALFLNYELVSELAHSFATQSTERVAMGKIPAFFILALIFMPFLGLIAGNVWGLVYGSEEIRVQSVGLLLSSMVMLGTLLLVALPSPMNPGWLKNACILIACLPAAALLAVVTHASVSLLADILWLILSLRICRRLGASGLAAAAERYRILWHVAQFGIEVRVPYHPQAQARLPLLLCSKNTKVLAGLVNRFPALSTQFRSMIASGIRKHPEEPYSMSIASLALDTVARSDFRAARSCLENLGRECLSSWSDRESFDTGAGMNGLEYVARRLCYLTNLEELIVVR